MLDGSGWHRTLVKVCGATRAEDFALLTDADLVGLWCGVPNGHADLSPARFAELAAASGPAQPVLVTLSSDSRFVSEVVADSGVTWVQLHGYQQPGMVRSLKANHPELRVVKVLHVLGAECVERTLTGAYERAGVDLFLIDAVGKDGAIGSTGQSVDVDVALTVAGSIETPFLLAGGVSTDNAAGFAAVREHPGFAGVDVDSGSRDEHGRFDPGRVAAIGREWTVRR